MRSGTLFFFFNDPATSYILSLSLHDALPIWLFPRQIRANTISFTVFPEIVPSIGNSFINTMKNINHTRSSISDDIRNILCSSANMRRAIPLILRLLMRSEERFSRNAETDLVCRLLLKKKKIHKKQRDTCHRDER